MVAGLYILYTLTNETSFNDFSGLNKITILYGVAVVYLGPGSMMMHGTNTEWGGWADNLSMVMYIIIPWLYNIYKMSEWSVNTFLRVYISIVVFYAVMRGLFGYGMGIGLDLFGVSIGLWVISEFLYRFWSPSMRFVSGFVGFLVLMIFGIFPSEVFFESGSDIIAPSDMMDGRIKLIRKELEKNQFYNTKILSYSAKYSSSYYGPFRDAIGSLKALGKSDKKTYQMDYSNRNEAIREIDLDLREGADLVMVKPAIPNLDIISDLKETFKVPILAYHVSGEYLMIKSAAKKNVFNERDLVIETLTSIKRAGASSIITYYAKEAAKWMN